MKKIVRLSLFFIFLLLVGCYEDKGNYSYENINRITIEPLEAVEGWTSSYGDTLKINPVLNFENGVVDDSHLTYQWSLEGVDNPEWNKRNFFWIADRVTGVGEDLVLTITDTRNGMKYYPGKPFYVRVNAEFDTSTGVAILSEKDGNSQLSFINFDIEFDYSGKRVKVKSGKIYQDIYQERQKEVLGQGPIRLYEHYIRSESGGSADANQILVLQNSGAVDVAAATLTKDIGLDKAFLGGAYPTSPDFKEASFMSYADVLVDREGKLYSRIKLTSTLYHSSYFFPDPLIFEKEVLKNCHLLTGIYRDNKFTLIHDKDNKRFLAIFDGVPSSFMNPNQESAGKIVKVPATPARVEDTPIGFIPLDNYGEYEFVNGGYYRPSTGYNNIGYFMVFKDKSGNYFRQSFSIYRSSTTLSISDAAFGKIDLPGTPTIVYPTQYSNSESADVFFAIGNKLYRFDRRNPSMGVSEYLTFDANIISISTECYMNRWGIIALANGKILILGIEDAKNLNPEEKIIYELPADVHFDNIVDAVLISGGNNW